MIEFFEGLPWYLRLTIAVAGFSMLWAPIAIWRLVERIHAQNERIISLLADIKFGNRDL